MKIRYLWLILLALIVLFFCIPAAKKLTDPQTKGLQTVQTLPTEDLPKPKEQIENIDDLIYAMNYLAFYRIDEKVYFSFSPDYQKSVFNPYTEFQKAYTQADLADVYACQMDDSKWSEQKLIGIQYSISKDIASKAPENKTETALVPSFDWHKANNPITKIPLEENQKKVEISCGNGEQLYFLAMNGYKPKPKKGSEAEKLYQEARSVLLEVIDQKMDTFAQIKAVYDWLTTTVLYDYDTAYSTETYLVKEQAYYLEGVFYNHYAVCDGKSKAYALLLNMLEIPCLRDTGQSENGDHAWNMVELNGKWYISCTTYGQATVTELNRAIPNYATLLAGKDTPYKDVWAYESQNHLDISSQLESKGYPIYQKMSSLSGLDLQVQNINDVQSLLTKVAAQSQREYKLEFEFVGNDEEFEANLIDYIAKEETASLMAVKSEGGAVYQVIYRNEK